MYHIGIAHETTPSLKGARCRDDEGEGRGRASEVDRPPADVNTAVPVRGPASATDDTRVPCVAAWPPAAPPCGSTA